MRSAILELRAGCRRGHRRLAQHYLLRWLLRWLLRLAEGMREVSSPPHRAFRGDDDYGSVRYFASSLTVIGLLIFILSYEWRRPSGAVDTPAIELQPVRTIQSRSAPMPDTRRRKAAKALIRQRPRRPRVRSDASAMAGSGRADRRAPRRADGRAHREAGGQRSSHDGASVAAPGPVRAGEQIGGRVEDDGDARSAQAADPALGVKTTAETSVGDPVTPEADDSGDDGDAPEDHSIVNEDGADDGGSD